MEKQTFKQYLFEAKNQLIAYHVTKQPPSSTQFLQYSKTKTAINQSDNIVGQILPWYLTSIFFSIGWAAALEWDEYRGAAYELQYPVDYLLSNFSCVLLKEDHMNARYVYLEYFIPDSDKDEYLTLVKQYLQDPQSKKSERPFIPVTGHPKMAKWRECAVNATPQQLKNFIVNELLITSKSDILNYLSHHNTTYCELLVQGKIPMSKALHVRQV